MVQKTSLRRVLYARSLWYVGVCLFVIFGLLLNTFLGSLPKTAEAATSSTMNFQARLLSSSGALVPDGYYNVQFKLYDAATVGNNVWTETYHQTNRVRVANGYLTVNLGSVTAFGSINWDQEHWLTMNIGGTANTPTPTWDGEMTPRLKLTAVPYAFQAGQLTKQSGANRGVLQFNTLTANRTINLPDESGTLCIQNSVNCGFLTGVPGNYIQNGTAPQTADFNVTGQGTVGGTLTANLFQGSGASLTNLNAGNVSSGTLNDARLSSNVMLLTGNQTVTGVKTFQGATATIMTIERTSNNNAALRFANTTNSMYAGVDVNAENFTIGTTENLSTSALLRVHRVSGNVHIMVGDLYTGGTSRLTNAGVLQNVSMDAAQLTGTINDARLGSNVALYDRAVSNFTGTLQQNGSAVCTVAGNCSGVGGMGDVLQGGNEFGQTMTIGTDDNYALNFETNGTTRMTISNLGAISTTGDMTIGGILSGNGSGLTNLNAGNVDAGTLADARLSSNVMLLTGNQNVTGIKTFSNTVNISGSNQIVFGGDTNLYRNSAGYLQTDGSFRAATVAASRGNANDQVFAGHVTGDTQVRYRVHAGGTLQWGDGTNTPDTNLYRSAANILQTDDSFNVVGSLTQNGSAVCTVAGNCAGVGGNGDILQGGNSFGAAMAIGTNDNFNLNFRTNNAVRMTLTTAGRLQLATNGGLQIGPDTYLYRSGADVLQTDDRFHILRVNASDAAMSFSKSGDSASSFYATASGGFNWGDGANPTDTNLYRSAANTLRTDDNLSVGGTITGNGSGLTSLNASNVSSGTLNDARLSDNVMLLSGAQNVTGVKTFNAALNMSGSNAITLGSDVSLSRTAANVLGLASGDSFNIINGNLQFGGTTVLDSSRVLQNISMDAAQLTGTIADARLSSNIPRLNATANFTGALQQGGNAVCTVAGNCAGVGGTGDILQGGNEFSEAMTLGTNDNYGLNFETNNITRLTIANTGAISTTGNLSVGGTLSGNGSGLTTLNGSNISSGTVANARLVNGGSLTVTAGNGLTGGGSVALGASTALAIGAGDGITVNTSSVAVDSSVCRTSGNCVGVGGTGDILQGGNSFTAAMTIGTNDNYGLNFETNNITRLTIANTGAISTTGNLSVGGTLSGNGSGLTTLNASNLSSGTVASGRVAGSYTGITGVGALNAGSITSGFGNINIGSSTFTGNGSGLTSLNGTNITTGTVADARLSSNVMLLDNAQTITGIKTFNNTVNVQGSNQIVLGGDTNLYRSAANVLTTDDNLKVNGRTTQFSNEYPVYRWNFGGGTDLDWKTIADISIGATLYDGASFRVDITDTRGNHGNTANVAPMTYFVSAYRSGGVLDDPDTGSVAGPIADYVRLVKTTLGEYELQVRQTVNHRHMQVQAQVLSEAQATIVYADNPVNGSTTGDIYMPSPTGWTQRFANIDVRGGLHTGGTIRLTSAGVLQNVSMDAAQLTGTIADARLSSNIARLNAAANFTAGLQVSGNNVCHAGNNCGYASASNTILQGGNSFTAAMTIGTNDNYALNFETNGTTRMTISNAGAVSTTGDLSVGGTLSGNGSGLTSLNATNISSGTLSDARLSTNVMQLNNNQIVTGIKTFNNTVNIQGSNTLTLGSDVSLSRTGANVLGLASGDSFNIISGNLQFGGTTVIDSSRVLQNVTANASIITAGTLSDARLSSNVALLNATANFTGGLQVSGNNVCHAGNNCNYAAASGSSNYIQNGTSPQTANFNVTGSGAVGGNFAVGVSSPTVINASSAMFAGIVPKMEILTGSSTGLYEEMVTIRHNAHSETAGTRRIGMILKMSSENSTGESSKMGGMVLESGSNYANSPSLFLVTSNEKRLQVTFGGNINIVSGDLQTNGTTRLTNAGVLQNVTANASIITAGTLNDARLSSNVALKNAAANFTAGLQVSGNNVCHAGNNCGFASASNAILQGGNSFTAAMTIGTNDNYDLNFETNGTTRMTISNAGAVSTTGNLSVGGTLSGNGSGLTSLNGSNISSGTVADARLSANVMQLNNNQIVTGIKTFNNTVNVQGANELTFGGDVSLSRTAANVLGLATGDSLNIINGNLQTGGTSRLTSAGILQNVSMDAAQLTGTINDARLSSNVALKNINNNFSVGQTITGTVTATAFSGSGASLTSLNASNLSSGTVASARISGSYTGITGTGALNAGSIASGFGNINIGTNTFTGNGSGLTSLNASNISSGTLNDGRLSGNVMLLDNNQTVTGVKTFGNTVNINGSNALSFNGATTGNKILLYSNTYGIGVESNTLTNWSSGQFRWRTGGTSVSTGAERMLLSNDGLTIKTGVNATGYTTSGTSNLYAGQWTRLGLCAITAQYQDCRSQATIVSQQDGGSIDRSTVDIRVKQQAAMGAAPYVRVHMYNNLGISVSDVVAVTTVNTGSETTVELYGRINSTYKAWGVNPLINTGTSQFTWQSGQAFDVSLPAGSQTTATYSEVNATDINASGTVVASLFQGSGADLTSLNAGNISTGTINDARLSSNVALKNINNNFTVGQTITGTVTATSFAGSGASLTNLNASNLSSGTVASGRVAGSYTGITGVGALNAGSITSGFGNINIGSSTFTGNGSGLTSLNGTNITTGTVADARLSSNIARLNAAANFTAGLQVSGNNVCHAGNNCGYASSSNTILQGGNSFTAAMTIGTNDNYDLNFETNGTTRLTVQSSGDVLVDSDLYVSSAVITDWLDVENSVDVGGSIFSEGNINSTRTSGGMNAFLAWVDGDATPRWQVNADGGTQWGNGTTFDTNLYRDSANTLRTDDNFSVGGTISGNGSGLTTLNGSNISSGTVADARLSSNVMLLTGNQIVTGIKTFNNTLNIQGSNAITLGSDVSISRTAANVLGLSSGDSLNIISGNLQMGGTTVITSARVLQNVTASAGILTSGTLADARLSSNVALLNRNSQIFTGNQQVFRNASNSTTAFRVQNAGGVSLFNVDTTNSTITADAYAYLEAGARVGSFSQVGSSLTVRAGSGNTGIYLNSSSGNSPFMTWGNGTQEFKARSNDTHFSLGHGSFTPTFTLSNTGQAAFQNSTNSTTAFQVQNAGGSALFNIDSANSKISLLNGVVRIGGDIDAPENLVASHTDFAGGDLEADGSTTYYYKVTAVTADGESAISNEESVMLDPIDAPSAAPTVSAGTGPATGLCGGAFSCEFIVTFCAYEDYGPTCVGGETTASPVSSSISSNQIQLSNIPLAPSGALSPYTWDEFGRAIYFTVYDSGNPVLTGLAGYINDNTTTTWDVPDYFYWSFGGQPPVDNTAYTMTNAVDLSWDAVSGASSYRVYRSATSGDQNLILVGTTTNTSFVDTGGGTSSNISRVATMALDGSILVKPQEESSNALQVQNTAGMSLFTVNTKDNRVVVGNGPSATPTLLVLDAKNTLGDPTCVNGGMYYRAVGTHQAKICIGGKWTAIGVPRVTSLPSNPSDGDEVYYAPSGTANPDRVGWHVRYDANISDSYKWVVLGGSPFYAENHAVYVLNTNNATWYEPTPSPARVYIYRAGIWDVTLDARIWANAANRYQVYTYQGAGHTAGSHDHIISPVDAGNPYTAQHNSNTRRTTFTGTGYITERVNASNVSGETYFSHRKIQAMPVRLAE